MVTRFIVGALAAIALTGSALAQTTNAPTANQPGAAPAGQAAQPGIRGVDASTVKMTFYTVDAADMLSSNLIGLDVHNLRNEEVGEIEDLIIDNGKTLKGVVIGVGGFLGLGERNVAVQPSSIVITRDGSGDMKAVVNTTKEELKNAPEFKFEGNFKREE